MAQVRDIAVIVGSLRRDAFNRRTRAGAGRLAPEAAEAATIVEIGDLPLYNQDSRPGSAAGRVGRLPGPGPGGGRDPVRRRPNITASMPGVLKNAIDVGSRPYGKSVWAKKPGAIISVTPGGLGAFGANHHLRQSCVFLDMPMMQQPEAYLSGAGDLFDEAGAVRDEKTTQFLRKFIQAYADWVEKILRGPGELA